MCLINDLITSSQIITIIAFYNFPCSVRKHGSFIIVSISVKRIYLKINPCLSINIILLSIKRSKID